MEKIIREDSDDPNSDIETSWLLESQLRSFCEDLNKEIQVG
jgi:hypothetical protein